MIPKHSLLSACEMFGPASETSAGISLFPSWVTAQPWHKQTWSSSSGVLSCREEAMQDMQDLATPVPGKRAAQSFPQIVFIGKKTRVMKFGDSVGYTSLLWTSVQRHLLKFFSLHWSTSNVKAQCWSRLRSECQLHFYWPSVTSKGFSSTNVQTGRLPWNLSAMLTYRFWTDFILRLMPENEH